MAGSIHYISMKYKRHTSPGKHIAVWSVREFPRELSEGGGRRVETHALHALQQQYDQNPEL